jgi:hypothetical protein
VAADVKLFGGYDRAVRVERFTWKLVPTVLPFCLVSLHFDPGMGETEITAWEKNIKVPSGHTLNILAIIPANEVKKHVHCREIRYKVKFKAAEPQPARASSFQSPRMISTFENLPHRPILEEELKRKKISAHGQYLKETR